MSEQKTAKQIAERFLRNADDREGLERAILRHMEHHVIGATKAEREACAKEADYYAKNSTTALMIAKDIRARSQSPTKPGEDNG